MADSTSFGALHATITANAIRRDHDHMREQIITNTAMVYQAAKASLPPGYDDGSVFRIVIGRNDPNSYYGAVTYQKRSPESVKVFIRGPNGESVEQAWINLFDATAEAVDFACCSLRTMSRHEMLLGGGTIQTN